MTMGEMASCIQHIPMTGDGPLTDKDLNLNEPTATATGILYIRKKGAYIEDNPQLRKPKPRPRPEGYYLPIDSYIKLSRLLDMNESDLERRLKNGDHRVRFVPFGYKTGEMSPTELANNEFMIALAGKKGAEKLAKAVERYNADFRSFNCDLIDDMYVPPEPVFASIRMKKFKGKMIMNISDGEHYDREQHGYRVWCG